VATDKNICQGHLLIPTLGIWKLPGLKPSLYIHLKCPSKRTRGAAAYPSSCRALPLPSHWGPWRASQPYPRRALSLWPFSRGQASQLSVGCWRGLHLFCDGCHQFVSL